MVFVGHVARLSGGEIALTRLLPALSQSVDVTVLLGEDGPLVGRLQQLGIAVEVLPVAASLRDVRKDTVRPGGVDLRALLALPGYVLRLQRRIRELDADIVHTNTLKAAFYGGIAGRLAGRPVVWHVRDRIAPDYLPRPAVTLVRAASKAIPSAVVVNSQSTLRTLPRQVRSLVLYNPVVPDAVESTQPRQPDIDRPFTVGVVGRLASWKGQHVFLDAFAEAFGGTEARGRIVGSALFGEEAYEQRLRTQAEELGIASQVEFRGFREDVWQELTELDVLVHCSVSAEPFGQVVLEGMRAGLPVVAANDGGPRELITNGLDGLLTAPGDPSELALALHRLRDDPELRRRLADAGHERSLLFTPERTAERLLRVYAEILPAS